MPNFRVNDLSIDLFGVVEVNNHQPIWSAFSAGQQLNVAIDDAALTIIADELQIDARCLAADACD
jgi:hypothetical protein